MCVYIYLEDSTYCSPEWTAQSCQFVLHRNFEVPKVPLGSLALCQWQRINAKRDGASISTSKGSRTAHWTALAFDIMLMNVFCTPPPYF